MTKNVVVPTTGRGTCAPAVRALERAGADVTLTSDPARAGTPTGLSSPGVGAPPTQGLRAIRGHEVIGRRLAGASVLGICVGMQILFERRPSTAETEGCGEWPGVVERLQAPVVPHMGVEHRRGGARQHAVPGHRGQRFTSCTPTASASGRS